MLTCSRLTRAHDLPIQVDAPAYIHIHIKRMFKRHVCMYNWYAWVQALCSIHASCNEVVHRPASKRRGQSTNR